HNRERNHRRQIAILEMEEYVSEVPTAVHDPEYRQQQRPIPIKGAFVSVKSRNRKNWNPDKKCREYNDRKRILDRDDDKRHDFQHAHCQRSPPKLPIYVAII